MTMYRIPSKQGLLSVCLHIVGSLDYPVDNGLFKILIYGINVVSLVQEEFPQIRLLSLYLHSGARAKQLIDMIFV